MSARTQMVLAGANSRTVSESIISQATGTAIGDMPGDGGLAAVFDGVTNQAQSSCATVPAVDSYVGKNYSGGSKAITKVIAYGSNNQGFFRSSNPSITLYLMAKATAPSSATDGTVLGSLAFTDTSNESAGRTITSSDPWTKYQYVWCRVSTPGTNDNVIAELQFYENTNA